VTWAGRDWIVRTLEADDETSLVAERGGGAAALARLDLGRAHGMIPPGAYRLERRQADLVLSGGEPDALRALEALGHADAALPLVLAQSAAAPDGVHGRALALVPGIESIAGLPGALTAFRGERRWRLPGERVLSLVGDEPRTRLLDGWTVTALESGSLAVGPGLVETVRRLDAAPPLDIALWIERRAAVRLVDQVIEALERVPIIGSREARPWRAAGRALAHFDRYHRLTVFASPQPPAVMIRLERRAAAVPN
jgi:hypothetical protein